MVLQFFNTRFKWDFELWACTVVEEIPYLLCYQIENVFVKIIIILIE